MASYIDGANAMTVTPAMTAKINLQYQASATPITIQLTTSADLIAVLNTRPINVLTTMSAKSYKAIWSGMKDSLVDSFYMNDKMYFLNGQDYFCYDGTHCQAVTPYIPTLSMSKDPAGGGTAYEDFNLLGSGFKDSFSSDGVATVYQLSLTNLDATAVTALVDNVVKTEGIDFTVDRTLGKVTFASVPAKGTNNVIITAYKTQPGFPNRIKKCTFHVLFGGTNDTRVFVSGNTDFPNMIWRSGLYDPTYFPENGFYKIGSDKEKVTGFAKQYDYLVIEKESSKGNMQYQLDSNGVATFPIKPLNDEVGTIAPRSIQIVNNNPISLDRTGVYTLSQSNVRDERNVQLISRNVDAKLLKETGLENAISIDYDRKYWLAINNRVYVFDYQISEWYIYNNIPASCFCEIDGTLYFGGQGRVYRFKKDTELYPYNDDGTPINAYWKSKYFSFGMDEVLKVIDKVFVSLQPGKRTSADVYYITNKKESELLKTVRMDQFDWFTFDFNYLSFIVSDFPQEARIRTKVKKVTHFQLILQNDRLDESMGILAVGIKYKFGSEVK